MRTFFKKEVAFERVLFFSDAVVAIALPLPELQKRFRLMLNLDMLKAPNVFDCGDF